MKFEGKWMDGTKKHPFLVERWSIFGATKSYEFSRFSFLYVLFEALGE